MAVIKDKNEPGRFLGEGVAFRAKLIGVLEVPEARGDRMCQEALADLKMAIRAAGEHKQRIQVHVAIDGLRLRDDKTGDSLYHHPVHKISFIAQDMTDSRAFGYIFGSPDTGHRFFGIKTDKAASQVVIAMRDLFQVVFELKKKEVEMAKQQLVDGKAVPASIARHTANTAVENKTKIVSLGDTCSMTSKGGSDTGAEGGVAELVDLEQELSSLRRGLTQVEGLTPSTDPFGDSFTSLPSTQKGLLPPPPSGSSTRGRSTPASTSSRSIFPSPGKAPPALPFDLATVAAEFEPTPALVDNLAEPPVSMDVSQPSSTTQSLSYDVFTELDPLGTGRSKPYVDKKLFFQELKNPPKKVLKDLVSTTQSLISDILPVSDSKIEHYGPATTMTSLTRHSGGSVAIVKPPQNALFSSNFFSADPFAETDPFDNTDPFSDSFKDDPFTSTQEIPKSTAVRSLDEKNKFSNYATMEEKNKFSNYATMEEKNKFSNYAMMVDKDKLSNYAMMVDKDKLSNYAMMVDKDKLSNYATMEEKNKFSNYAMMVDKDKLSNYAMMVDKDKLSNYATMEETKPVENGKNVFNGPLQVSLPPEPAPKSPRLQRQNTDGMSVRQRPVASSKLADSASPPPPLPPKKEPLLRAPPRPPPDLDDEAPPLPKPAMRREPTADRSMKPRLSSAATNSSEDEYLTPAPPPLPTARRFDITLSQLLTCSMDELAHRLRVPATTLSSMTLPQLTEYLRSYLAADTDRAHIHVEPSTKTDKDKPITSLSGVSTPSTTLEKSVPPPAAAIINDFKPQFEDNFAPTAETSDTFVANFDDFDKKANPSYDRYAAFREIQEEELKAKSILDPIDALEAEPKQDSDEKELAAIDNLMRANQERDSDSKELSRSPLKTLDELTLDSFNMFRNSVSPKPSQIDAKIEDIKSVMKTLQITEKARRSVSPRDNGHVEVKQEDMNDRYAALREITITEPSQDEFESIPPEVPKERKKSDEKSDGFDNSDFFDCIDNSSLSFTHVEDAFRKSPMVVKEREEEKIPHIPPPEKKETPIELTPVPVRDLQPPPTRLSTGSISDVVSGSSPDTKEKCVSVSGVAGGAVPGAGRWAVLGGAAASGGSSDSRDSSPRRRRRPRHHAHPAHPTHPTHAHAPHTPPTRAPIVQTSSSSRDVSPWDEELPPVTRLQRPPSHRDRESSRHNSSGSRECLDSGSGREKEKLREKRDMRERDRDISRDGRDSARDRRDSGSGRDRRDGSKERDHRDHRDRRDRRSRDRENDSWDRDRTYSRERDYRDSRSRERPTKDYRDKDRDRHRKARFSYDEEEDYSDGCGSGRSSPRERWPDRWRRDERNYGSLGWRETRRRAEMRQSEDPSDRRYGSTLGWSSRRANTSVRRDSSRERDRERDVTRDVTRDARRRPRREEPRRPRDYRFSNDFSPREREHTSPFDNDFHDTPTPTGKKRTTYTSLEGTRFAFEPEEATASPASGASSAREGSSTRFRFDSESMSPRSMFEDDFSNPAPPRPRTASIAEEEEGEIPPLRVRPPITTNSRDIRKSDSVNIFTRESDPFEGDAFFACTGSDRAARRENWPGDFQGFDNA